MADRLRLLKRFKHCKNATRSESIQWNVHTAGVTSNFNSTYVKERKGGEEKGCEEKGVEWRERRSRKRNERERDGGETRGKGRKEWDPTKFGEKLTPLEVK